MTNESIYSDFSMKSKLHLDDASLHASKQSQQSHLNPLAFALLVMAHNLTLLQNGSFLQLRNMMQFLSQKDQMEKSMDQFKYPTPPNQPPQTAPPMYHTITYKIWSYRQTKIIKTRTPNPAYQEWLQQLSAYKQQLSDWEEGCKNVDVQKQTINTSIQQTRSQAGNEQSLNAALFSMMSQTCTQISSFIRQINSLQQSLSKPLEQLAKKH